MKKIRLDVFLVESGKSESREKAKREILAGWVQVNGETVRSSSARIRGDEQIQVKRPKGFFVSRGGEKLGFALEYFNLDVVGSICADLGASTGGFTDCLLRAGALRVYSIDVGYGQLDYRLRQDERVVVMERSHVKDLTSDQFSEPVDFVTADLSFISITRIFPMVNELFAPCRGVILIKPQFEAERNEQKKGVVRDKKNCGEIVLRVLKKLIEQGLNFRGLIHSPLKGPAGNIEFLLNYETGFESYNSFPDNELAGIVGDSVRAAFSELS